VCLGLFFFRGEQPFLCPYFQKKNTTNYVSFDGADNTSSDYPNSSHHQGAGKGIVLP
jgi:hypothetical protein